MWGILAGFEAVPRVMVPRVSLREFDEFRTDAVDRGDPLLDLGLFVGDEVTVVAGGPTGQIADREEGRDVR